MTEPTGHNGPADADPPQGGPAAATDSQPPRVTGTPDAQAHTHKGKRERRGVPKWEQETRERIRSHVRRFSKPLADLVERDANEGDTRLLVTDMLCEAFGFDKYADLTTEYRVRNDYADYGLRIDQQLVAFIEVKRCTTKLSTKHLRQVEMYAVNEGVEWVILTNGVVWQAYHLTGGLPIAIELVLEVDLLDEQTGPTHKANQLFYLSRESLKRHQIEDLWKARAATSPKSLVRVLLSDPVMDAARRQLKRQSGHSIDSAELARLVRDTVVRPDAV